MTIAINSTSILNGIMCIDATVTAPAGHKLRSFFITCGGEYAYYLIPRTYYVSDASAYTQSPQVILSGRSISKFPLAQWPNGDISFIISAKYQNITTSVTVTESAPVTVNVTNTFYEVPQAPDPIVQPGGQLDEPVVTVFDPVPTETLNVPITISAKDNNAVAGYFVSDSPATPAASNPAWSMSPSYTAASYDTTLTLYAWAKDADGNISDPVSAQVVVPPPPPPFTPLAGKYIEPQTVTLTGTGDTYYTLDGSDPRDQLITDGGLALYDNGAIVTVDDSTLIAYNGPMTVQSDTTIRFITIAADRTISETYTATYDFPPPLAFSAQPAVVSGATITYGTYDPAFDDVVSTTDVSTTVTAIAVMREAASALISAGVTVSSTLTMLEQVFVAAQATTLVTGTLKQVESLVAQIQAFPTVSDILNLAAVVPKVPFIFTAQPTTVANDGVVYYGTADTGADDVTATAGTAATVTDIMTRVEQAVATVQAVPTVADIMAQIDQLTTIAQAEATVADQVVRAVAENLLSAATSLTTVADQQIMVNAVTTVAQTSASLTAVMRYLENLTAVAQADTTVKDVLIAMLDVGPHARIDLISPITRLVDVLSPITRTVDITSKVRLAA